MSIDSTDGCDSNAVSIVKIGPAVFIPWPFEKSKSLLLANSYRICQYVGRSGLSVCLFVCLWTSLRRYNTVSLQHINMTSTSQHSLTLNYRLTFFQRSRSKVKVTGVKSSIFGLHAITQKVFVRFSQNSQDWSSEVWDRSLFQDDLEKSKVKVTAGVKVQKFTKNDLITHFLS